jgi:hypothetical protein
LLLAECSAESGLTVTQESVVTIVANCVVLTRSGSAVIHLALTPVANVTGAVTVARKSIDSIAASASVETGRRLAVVDVRLAVGAAESRRADAFVLTTVGCGTFRLEAGSVVQTQVDLAGSGKKRILAGRP